MALLHLLQAILQLQYLCHDLCLLVLVHKVLVVLDDIVAVRPLGRLLLGLLLHLLLLLGLLRSLELLLTPLVSCRAVLRRTSAAFHLVRWNFSRVAASAAATVLLLGIVPRVLRPLASHLLFVGGGGVGVGAAAWYLGERGLVLLLLLVIDGWHSFLILLRVLPNRREQVNNDNRVFFLLTVYCRD